MSDYLDRDAVDTDGSGSDKDFDDNSEPFKGTGSGDDDEGDCLMDDDDILKQNVPAKVAKPHKRHADLYEVQPTKSKKRKVAEDETDSVESESASEDLDDFTHAQLDNEEAAMSEAEYSTTKIAKVVRSNKSKAFKPTMHARQRARTITSESSDPESDSIEVQKKKLKSKQQAQEQSEFAAAPYDADSGPLKLAPKGAAAKLLSMPPQQVVSEIKTSTNGRSSAKTAKTPLSMDLGCEFVMGTQAFVVTHCAAHCPMKEGKNDVNNAELRSEHCYTARHKDSDKLTLVVYNPLLNRPREISHTSFKCIANSKKNAELLHTALEHNNRLVHSETDIQMFVEKKTFEDLKMKSEKRKAHTAAKSKSKQAAAPANGDVTVVDLTGSNPTQSPVTTSVKPTQSPVKTSVKPKPKPKPKPAKSVENGRSKMVTDALQQLQRTDGEDLFYSYLENLVKVQGFPEVSEWVKDHFEVMDERLKMGSEDAIRQYFAKEAEDGLSMDCLKPLLFLTVRGRKILSDLANDWCTTKS